MCNTLAVRSVVQNLVSCSSSHALRCATTFLSLTSAIGIANIVTIIITITNITISITILTTSKMNISCLCDINDPSLSVLKLLEVARDLTAGNFLIEKLPKYPPPPPATPQFWSRSVTVGTYSDVYILQRIFVNSKWFIWGQKIFSNHEIAEYRPITSISKWWACYTVYPGSWKRIFSNSKSCGRVKK